MSHEHKKEDKLKVESFLKKIESYGEEDIEATYHTFFRLSQKQRKIYTENELKRIIFDKRPMEVIVQKNGNLSVIYEYNNKFLKIVLNLTPNKIYIVTFYILNRNQEGEIGK